MPVKSKGFKFISNAGLGEALAAMDAIAIPGLVQGSYPELVAVLLPGGLDYKADEDTAIEQQDEINDAIFMLTAAFVAGASTVSYTFGQHLCTGMVIEDSDKVIEGLERYNRS